MRPEAVAPRTLSNKESELITDAFSDVNYHKRPDRICRQLAIDPCLIERHAWDAKELSDYVCGADRLSDGQRSEIRNLLANLQSGE